MNGNSGSAPAWLFAFVDLAFLLLLGMTQLEGNALDLGEIVVPQIGGEAASALAAGSERTWQLRVHPASETGETPFELIAQGVASERLAADQLRVRLQEIEEASGSKPLLAPHADSRSQDLLEAVALIEEVWPGRRRSMIERLRVQP